MLAAIALGMAAANSPLVDTYRLIHHFPLRLTYVIYLFLIIAPPAILTYHHMRLFALTIVAVVVVDILFLRYAYISFICLLAGLGTLHLIYISLCVTNARANVRSCSHEPRMTDARARKERR